MIGESFTGYATDTNSALNMRTLENNIIRDIQLPADRGTWSVDQRYQYSQRLAGFIVSHPASFSEPIVTEATAYFQVGHAQGSDYDVSFLSNVSQFGNNVIDNAGVLLPKLGFASAGLLLGGALIFGLAVIYFNSKSGVARAKAKPVAK